MTDRIKHYLEIGGAIVAALVIALAAQSWLEQRDALTNLKATVTAQDARLKQLDQSVKTRTAGGEVQKQAIDKKVAAAKTPQDQAALLSQMAGFSHPITFQVPTPAYPGAPPEAPSARLTVEDVAKLTQLGGACQKDQVDLAVCRGNLVDQKTATAAEHEKFTKADQAVKGGTRWERFKHNGKMMFVGGVLTVTAEEVIRRTVHR